MQYTALEKSPDDDMVYEWDYTNEDTFIDDPIASAAATNWSGGALSGITVGAAAIDADGRIVQTRISGGTAGASYQIKLKATSTAGYDRDAFLLIQVRVPTVPA
jgi:hypothetical protein